MHTFMHANKVMKQRYQVSCTDNARKLDLAHKINAFHLQISPRSAHTYSTNLCRRSATSQTCLRGTSSSCSRSTAGGVQPCSSRPYPTGRARWTSGSDGLVPRPSEPRISTRCSAFGPQRKPSPAQQSGRGGSGRRSQYDLSACSLAKAPKCARATRSEG